MLKIPDYIQDSGVVGAKIGYEWRPYLHLKLVEKAPKNLQSLIQSISCRGTFALDLGIAEWLAWRLHGLASESRTLLYLEALWASSIDERYLKVPLPERSKDKSDPGNGPLYGLEIEIFNATTNARLDHPERAKTAAGLVSLVKYFLPDPAPFDRWLKATLTRFPASFPYKKDEPKGVWVPRKYLDPEVPIDMDAIPGLLDEQLREIDRDQNTFLATPVELKAAGFQGEPYRFTL